MEWHEQVDSKLKGEMELLALVLVAVCSIIGARMMSLPAVLVSALEHTMFVGVLSMSAVLAFFAYLLTEICMVTCDIITGGIGIESQ